MENIIYNDNFKKCFKRLKSAFHNEMYEILLNKINNDFIKNPKIISFFKDYYNLPKITPKVLDFSKDSIIIGRKFEINTKEKKELIKTLQNLMPWRKGPFDLFGINIDAEWQSHLKWNRLKNHIPSLKGKKILDVGSNSGYYMFKMLEHKPKLILGLEPYFMYYAQFILLNHFANIQNIHTLPVRMEELPKTHEFFDIIFYMGIIYHNRSPFDSLKTISTHLKPKGKVIIETLIIESNEDISITPNKRYAKMNNVFFIPSIPCLNNWLLRSGFKKIKLIDTSKTTSNEQRKTKWVNTESLNDFLDPKNMNKTIEGYPAPLRAILLAEKY